MEPRNPNRSCLVRGGRRTKVLTNPMSMRWERIHKVGDKKNHNGGKDDIHVVVVNDAAIEKKKDVRLENCKVKRRATKPNVTLLVATPNVTPIVLGDSEDLAPKLTSTTPFILPCHEELTPFVSPSLTASVTSPWTTNGNSPLHSNSCNARLVDTIGLSMGFAGGNFGYTIRDPPTNLH